MSSTPVISVITVCRNSALTIRRALLSVAEQDWQGLQHVVIDGGSSDGTQAIIEREGRRVDVFVSEPDKGIYDAMNKGLERATGDIICFLNADDCYAHSRVLSIVAGQMWQAGLDALLGDVAYFRKGDPQRIVRRFRSDRFSPERLAWGWMPAHPALFFRKEVVRRVGHFKTHYRIAGDYEFVVRAFHGQALRYRHWPEVLVLMEMGGISTGGLRNTLLLNREVLQACRENGVSTNYFKILSKYPRKLLEFARL
jgi:glycosyltransferase involved in cell wall biosynthesis